MLRRLHAQQPASFAFTPANQAWAEAQITKYPEGRQASAIIPLLWRAQEQEGWLTRPAIEHVAGLLGMPYIRALEVATFYFMFQLQPVGSVAHIQICGTTSCMICGAEDLIAVCKAKIAPKAHQLSADGRFSWEEVECLGACTNAPMAQIGKDYYEDLNAERLERLLDELAAGKTPVPGPQNGRYASEPLSGLTSLKDFESGRRQYNASAQRAVDVGDGIRRIDGTEVPLIVSWRRKPEPEAPAAAAEPAPAAAGIAPERAEALAKGKPEVDVPMPEGTGTAAPGQPVHDPAPVADAGVKPVGLTEARGGAADDLQKIEGIGPVLEKLCHELGIFHFDQIAAWGPEEVAWMDGNLKGFRGRVTRDRWVAQAKLIGEVGMEEFLRRAKTNDY
ncbi:NADH-quinone oxidoreductase subunit E [Ruixingdingia sedimenti]|uniref:NADH-quinone oxidoreductase subunit E n=1 Tax=Ruixingdingia sedimenti TaxID=3073604 RepID=A0ABU1F353_9RHOB|nr:NADH-quinone oxidoreductase subunit E [Xinfangfangia sp. LG-4]MDR5651301.1 NADH-quinone oxidoreductase subunit E [Xinfangfangia sp. LG-4]